MPDEGPRVVGIYAANGDKIVETDSGVYPPFLGDALLIAAATDMLAALKAVVESDFSSPSELVKVCAAAIAKAEGQVG